MDAATTNSRRILWDFAVCVNYLHWQCIPEVETGAGHICPAPSLVFWDGPLFLADEIHGQESLAEELDETGCVSIPLGVDGDDVRFARNEVFELIDAKRAAAGSSLITLWFTVMKKDMKRILFEMDLNFRRSRIFGGLILPVIEPESL